jgi:hypothetical protein
MSQDDAAVYFNPPANGKAHMAHQLLVVADVWSAR